MEKKITVEEFKSGKFAGRQAQGKYKLDKAQIEINKEKQSDLAPKAKDLPATYEGANEEEFLKLMEYLIGSSSTKTVHSLSAGRGLSAVECLRQGLHNAFETGAFDCEGAGESRTGNDENFNHVENKRIIALIGMGNFHRLADAARSRRTTNKCGLSAGVAWALSRAEI